jgi:hypothetical protein
MSGHVFQARRPAGAPASQNAPAQAATVTTDLPGSTDGLDALHAALNGSPKVSQAIQLRRTLSQAPRSAQLTRMAKMAQRVSWTGSGVVQAWRDHRNKWHDGKPDESQWESFTDPKGNTLWRPKEGSDAWREDRETREAEAQKGQQTKAKNEQRARDWETKSQDTETIFLEDASVILYTQDSISATFSNGKTIQSMRDALKREELTAADVEPIMVQLWEGRLYSYDNRRLWAFKGAGKQVLCRFATAREIEANAFKLTGDGKKVSVRK